MVVCRRIYGWVLGLVLVAHGLANAVLPLRGADAATAGDQFAPMTALCVVAIVGFVAAGLGVLRVRPLTRLVIPASLTAGVAALAAQFWKADSDLWPGIILSASLPLLATMYWVGCAEFVARPVLVPLWRRMVNAAALVLFGWITVSAVLWPWHRAWGTTPVEWQLSLPGDSVPRAPAFEIMHAVTIDAPPEAIWPWLVRDGEDITGFYSDAWLERTLGAPGLFGSRPDEAVDRLVPNRVLVVHNRGAFVLSPLPNGRTRLLVRSTISSDRIPAWMAAVNFTTFELPHFIMQRRMLLGIKAHAEHAGRG